MQQAFNADEQAMGAVLFVDVDNFKNLNDSLGHSMGDRYLLQLALRLESSVPDDGTIARIGGDEFVVLLNNLSAEPDQARFQVERITERVREALTLPYRLANHDYTGSFSIGVTQFQARNQTWEDPLKRADIALHEAKKAGRNTTRLFTAQMQRNVEQKLELESEVRRALAKAQFTLHYQPQVLEGEPVSSVEALIRWHHPEESWRGWSTCIRADSVLL